MSDGAWIIDKRKDNRANPGFRVNIPEYGRFVLSGAYPNPAFGRMTEADAAWMARIIAHFDDKLVAAAVKVGAYDAPSARYLTETLIPRASLRLGTAARFSPRRDRASGGNVPPSVSVRNVYFRANAHANRRHTL